MNNQQKSINMLRLLWWQFISRGKLNKTEILSLLCIICLQRIKIIALFLYIFQSFSRENFLLVKEYEFYEYHNLASLQQDKESVQKYLIFLLKFLLLTFPTAARCSQNLWKSSSLNSSWHVVNTALWMATMVLPALPSPVYKPSAFQGLKRWKELTVCNI